MSSGQGSAQGWEPESVRALVPEQELGQALAQGPVPELALVPVQELGSARASV